MSKAVVFFKLKNNIWDLVLAVFMVFNTVSVGTLMLNNKLVQKAVLKLGTNIVKEDEYDFDITDIAKVYPVINANNYIIEEVETVEPIIPEEEESTPKLDYAVVDKFTYSKPSTGDEVVITEGGEYQRVKVQGIEITNYSDNREIDYLPLMSKDVSLNRLKDKVLLYSTHTSESYVQSEGYTFEYSGTMRTKEDKYNMLSVGAVLKQTLEENDINCIHDTTPHDYTSYENAYSNSRATVRANLNTYGKLGLSIDVHRDAYGDLYDSPVVLVNDKEVAKIMLVVGIGTTGYENEYWEANLALAMQIMQLGEKMYPGLFRPLLVRSSRYNQDLNEGSFLIEVGATGNTHEEIYYATRCFGNILAEFYNK